MEILPIQPGRVDTFAGVEFSRQATYTQLSRNLKKPSESPLEEPLIQSLGFFQITGANNIQSNHTVSG